jgi:predicted nucleotidyltransferase
MSIKLSGLSEEETKQIVPAQTILLGYMGSTAHGTHMPKDDPNSIDDKDIMGVYFAPKEFYFGLEEANDKKKLENIIVKQGEWDSVVYEIQKFFRLLMRQNPNVLGLLWLDRQNYIHIDPLGQKIIDNRELFSSKGAYDSFVGYAKSQLHKMTHLAYEGYMGEKRKKLVDKYGFDTKNAAHLIRLMRMCIEFLTDGKFRVFREDAKELKSIKRGEWSLEKVKEEAERLFVLAQEAFVRSDLPNQPDKDKVQTLLMEILEDRFETI